MSFTSEKKDRRSSLGSSEDDEFVLSRRKSGQANRTAWEISENNQYQGKYCDGDNNDVVPFTFEDSDDDEIEETKQNSDSTTKLNYEDEDYEDQSSSVGDDMEQQQMEMKSEEPRGLIGDISLHSSVSSYGVVEHPETSDAEEESLKQREERLYISPLHIIESRKGKMQQCVLIRSRQGANLLQPQYRLYLQASNKLILLAQKKLQKGVAKYHFFDMKDEIIGKKLSKNHTSFVGSMRSDATEKLEFTLTGKEKDCPELCAIMHNKIVDANMPREFKVVLPGVKNNKVYPHLSYSDTDSMIDLYRSRDVDKLTVLEAKYPVMENGCYRLNFGGRVLIPSVKNFQLCMENDDQVVVQFGRVADHRFHLDFLPPVTPIQALAISLTHFGSII